MTKKDKNILLNLKVDIKFCFEDFLIDNYNDIEETENELLTSFYSDRFWGKYDFITRRKLLSCQFLFCMTRIIRNSYNLM